MPALAILGALAVLSPVLIHLLNKRKFKIVDWAAMDFLLDADKRNRRRVRLENFLILLLRCLAMLLLGLLLARPFIPSGIAAGMLDSAQYEHIVILDDSLSTQVQASSQSAFEEAKQRLSEMLRSLAKDNHQNTFTLILTSAPDQRLANGMRVTTDTVDELVNTINDLQPTDLAADMSTLLVTLEQEVKMQPQNVNRLVYLVSDLRRRDWDADENAATENNPAEVVARISKLATAVYILDIGGESYGNVMVTDVRPEGVLVAGVSSRFDVTVHNYGGSEARDLIVKFKAGDGLELDAPIDRLPSNQSTTVPFSFTFSDSGDVAPDGSLLPLRAVEVEVTVASSRPGDEDRLLADSTGYFAARVVRGIPTLIVDGDPSSNEERSESFFLKHALEPNGPLLSGVSVDVVHEPEMETISLNKYQVIFLCNVYRFSDKVINDLKAWTERGGGLVIMPGDQVDERFFNEKYFNDGKGISPLKLEGILGDETEEKWVNFKVENTAHPVLGVFEGQNNPALELTKVFRWWNMSAAPGQVGDTIEVSARFNDAEQSIAMAEKKYGKGRVFISAIPADTDWHLWPVFGTYLISMEELVRYMAGDVAGSGGLHVGEPLVQTVELSDYKTDAELRAPRDKKVSLQAREPGAKKETNLAAPQDKKEGADKGDKKSEVAQPTPSPAGATQTQWQFVYEPTLQRGFYNLQLSRNDGGDEKVLFAANAVADEGDLTRVDLAELSKTLGDRVKIISSASTTALVAVGSQRELWKYLLLILVLVLCGEQLLAWSFGLKR